MRKSYSANPRLGMLALSIAALFAFARPATADLTGDQILDRCRQAYRSLTSYRGTTHVVSKNNVAGASSTYNTMAAIQFVRPSRIRVEGSLMSSGRFAIVSDGAHTWQSSIGSPGKWERAQSTEMAIAAFTGVAQNAATTIPAILVGAMWGDPFGEQSAGKVTRESLNGQSTYRVDSSGPLGRSTFWIDRKTFLLVRLRRLNDLSRLSRAIPKDAKLPKEMPSSGVTDVTETFTDVRTNVTIPSSAFTRPPGAPQ